MKTVALIITLMFPLFAYSAAIWSPSTTIRGFYPLSGGIFVITLNEDAPSCTNGSSPNKYYYVKVGENSMTQEGADKIFSAALAAAASGKKVRFSFDDSTPYCYINRLYVDFE